MEIKIHRSVKIISIITIILAIFILYLRFIGTSGLVVKEYKVKSKNIGFYHGLKIVHFSDIHYKTTFNQNDLNNLVEKINYINPDIVVFTGDIFDKKIEYSNKDVKVLNEAFNKINAKYKKYAVKGDCDSELFDEVIKNSNFIILDNDYDLLYINNIKPILIAGFNDNLNKINDYISSDKANQTYSILLTHEPDNIKNTDSFDLVLAGHSMNGQVRLPFIGGLIKTNGALTYNDEYYKINNTDLYISGGLGSKKVNLRLLNKPSINFYRIVKEMSN